MATTLFVSFAAAVATNTSYDHVRSQRSVAFSGIAYCSGTLGKGVENWDCHACKQFPDVVASSFTSSPRNQNGFVAWDPHDGPNGSIVVSFTGTDPLKLRQWIEDLDFVLVDYGLCSDCQVHQGFFLNYLSVRDHVFELLSNLVAAHPSAPVRITGHSLGAAVALHLAVELLSNSDAGNVAIDDLYTFGQPRVGNAAFERWTRQLIQGLHFRVTHRRDPVPHLPPASFGFVHPPLEVFYPKESAGPFRECDGSGEDPSCSNQYDLDIVITDHTEYVGFDFIGNYLLCKL